MMSGFQQAQLNQQPLAIKNSSLSIPQPAQQIMNSPADLQDSQAAAKKQKPKRQAKQSEDSILPAKRKRSEDPNYKEQSEDES